MKRKSILFDFDKADDCTSVRIRHLCLPLENIWCMNTCTVPKTTTDYPVGSKIIDCFSRCYSNQQWANQKAIRHLLHSADKTVSDCLYQRVYVWLSFLKTRTVKVSSFALVSSIFPRDIRFLANYVLQQSAIRLHDLQFPLSWRRYCTRCKFCFKQFFCFSVALESHLSEYEHRFIPLLALCVPH